MVPEGNALPQDLHVRRRGSLGAVLVIAVLAVGIAAPLFALAAKALYAVVLDGEAHAILEASATCAFPCLSLARLGSGIGEEDMAAFRAVLESEIEANAASGPLGGLVVSVEAELVSDSTVDCRMRYRPGRLREGLFGDAVPDVAEVACRVDLPAEP